jgi:hypothetical protein
MPSTPMCHSSLFAHTTAFSHVCASHPREPPQKRVQRGHWFETTDEAQPPEFAVFGPFWAFWQAGLRSTVTRTIISVVREVTARPTTLKHANPTAFLQWEKQKPNGLSCEGWSGSAHNLYRCTTRVPAAPISEGTPLAQVVRGTPMACTTHSDATPACAHRHAPSCHPLYG